MKKHALCLWAFLICLATVLMTAPVSVLQAAGPIDTEASCVLDIAFIPENTPMEGIEFRLYRIAAISSSCRFTVLPRFDEFHFDDLLEEPDAEGYMTIASTLAGAIAEKGIAPDATAVTDETGHAVFKNLPVGLYLLMGDKAHYNDNYYFPQNSVICLPERTEGDVWNYLVSASVKWYKELDSEPIDISVMKIWEDSAVNLHDNESVEVTLYRDGVFYDKQLLNKENGWQYAWKGLSSNPIWTVTEKKVTNYTTRIVRKGNLFVITNKKPDIPPPVPDTGMTWWPIPVLMGTGIVFFIISLFVKNKGKQDEGE